MSMNRKTCKEAPLETSQDHMPARILAGGIPSRRCFQRTWAIRPYDRVEPYRPTVGEDVEGSLD